MLFYTTYHCHGFYRGECNNDMYETQKVYYRRLKIVVIGCCNCKKLEGTAPKFKTQSSSY